MSFISFSFICLVIITFSIYYIPRFSKFQMHLLILSSIIFYSINQPILVFLLIFSIGINVVSSYLIVYGNSSYRKKVAVTGVLINLFLLLFFKYSPFFSNLFYGENSSVGHFLLMIPLPLGISFSTFQGISMLIDIYRGRDVRSKEIIPRQFIKHAINITFYKSFFPQSVAGPIVRVFDILSQVNSKYFKDINWEKSFKALVTGYFLKMVVADNLQDFTYWINYPYFLGQPAGKLLIMLLGYSCQIFADFAGYSLIAIGLAQLFGYSFKDNFDFPYISTSLKEFWARWHISLSTWLREYIFLPVAYFVSGKMKRQQYFKIKTENWIYAIATIITFFICGFWHGAGINYIIWGCLFGIALVIERFFLGLFKRKGKMKKKSSVTLVTKGFLVMGFVTLMWIFFIFNDVKIIISFFEHIVSNRTIGSIAEMFKVIIYCVPVLVYHLIYLTRKKKSYDRYGKFEFLVYGLMMFLIVTNSHPSIAFIYFQF